MEFASLKDWLERLKEFSEKEKTVVLVEGKKDKQKLEKFGISHIYSIKGKKFYDILEELENEDLVIILTDLDKQHIEDIPADLEENVNAGKKNYPLP